METLTIIGLLGGAAGLVAVLAGFGVMLWGMGYREYLGGKKRPKGIAPAGKDELRRRLLALNSSELPYELKPSQETDLSMEWRIVDARWLALFSRQQKRETYRAYILLDEGRKAVRYYEEMGKVIWSVGSDGLTMPKVSYRNEFFKGRILFRKSWGVQYAIGDNLTPAKIYEYKFDIGQLREPLQKTTTESGWEFVPVVRKDHASFPTV